SLALSGPGRDQASAWISHLCACRRSEHLADPGPRRPLGVLHRASAARRRAPMDRQRGGGMGGGLDVDPRRPGGSARVRRRSDDEPAHRGVDLFLHAIAPAGQPLPLRDLRGTCHAVPPPRGHLHGRLRSGAPGAAGGRFYEHYFLQFVPPLSILAAPGAAAIATRWREIAPRARAFALAGVGVPLAIWLAFSWGRGIAGAYPEQEPRTRALAQWLRSHSAPGDTLFVWGHYSPIYTMSDRLPGTRYLNTSPHRGNFDPAHLPATFDPARHRAQRDVDATLEDLEKRRPSWFVDTSPAGIHLWARIPLSAFP